MGVKDQELSLDEIGDLELGDSAEATSQPVDEGLELSLGDSAVLDLNPDASVDQVPVDDGAMDFSLDFSQANINSGPTEGSKVDEPILNLNEDFSKTMARLGFALDESDMAPAFEGEAIKSSANLALVEGAAKVEEDLSNETKEKLKEIDEIMDHDASQSNINLGDMSADLNQPLEADDLKLDSLDFSVEEAFEREVEKEAPPLQILREAAPAVAEVRPIKHESAALYESDEIERTHATIVNLRDDRKELLEKIQKLEEDKMIQSRNNLTLRAELDERKIELTIIRKKLNEEINDLKDRMRLSDERKLILEEKNRIMLQELDKLGQRNRIDVKKVQMRERELEQKLELLKADAETQIRNRDQKILELKRKIDAMEFDVESITHQEKKSVESRFVLEDKLDKAIKTLRSAISVLEEESDRTNALEALKKNIDM